MEFSILFTKTLGIFTLLGNVALVLLLVVHVAAKPLFKKITEWVGEHVLLLGFLLSAGATVGSLVYSEVVGYPACILCWIQRIFMYPLPFLFGLALVRRDRSVVPYALLLAVTGGIVAAYQWTKDMLALYSNVTVPCPAVSDLPSCDRIYVLEFGYITIAMIALNAFLLIAAVLYMSARRTK